MKIKILCCLLFALTLSIGINAQTKRKPVAGKTKVASAKGNLAVEAGLLFNSGDVKPVVRATFYLLKDDAKNIVLTQENLNLYNQELDYGKVNSLSEWSMYAAILYLDGRYTPNYATTVKTALEKNSVGSTTTGFDGKASFDSIPTGNYYLFGTYNFGKETTFWNIPVSVKVGANKIVLDNDNMR